MLASDGVEIALANLDSLIAYTVGGGGRSIVKGVMAKES